MEPIRFSEIKEVETVQFVHVYVGEHTVGTLSRRMSSYDVGVDENSWNLNDDLKMAFGDVDTSFHSIESLRTFLRSRWTATEKDHVEQIEDELNALPDDGIAYSKIKIEDDGTYTVTSVDISGNYFSTNIKVDNFVPLRKILMKRYNKRHNCFNKLRDAVGHFMYQTPEVQEKMIVFRIGGGNVSSKR